MRRRARSPLVLHEDRFFDSDPAIRAAARSLYDETRDLPLVCPHGHVDPALLATNTPFPDPASLLIVPDHYIFRMLYSRGVPLESLGVAPRRAVGGGGGVETDPRAIWQVFAEHSYLFRGTPSGAWLDHELRQLFEVTVRLDGDSAPYVYDQIAERLASKEFRPRALFDRFNIEVLATTDKASDSLQHHRAIRDSEWNGRVIPTFRPDAVFQVANEDWSIELQALAAAHGRPIDDFASFVAALEGRRRYFRAFDASATDHAVLEPATGRLPADDTRDIFRKALRGEATKADQRRFEAHMLIEMARMSVDDGLVMQLHPGSFRDHNHAVFERFGADKGADIPVTTEFTRNLESLLNEFGNDPRFTLVLFTLDESTYSRELAPLAGHYPAVKLGPPWWFHDSIEGMARFRAQVTETAGIYNTAGFNDDTRAFCSIPARHDLSRRVDANYLGGLVARHIVSLDDARDMARALAYELARETYRLSAPPPAHNDARLAAAESSR
jgi:glucuronate isomerase